MKVKCVLFDFDGTFADTSVDMCNALNLVLLNFNNELSSKK